MLFDFNDFLHVGLNKFVVSKNVKFKGIGCFYSINWAPINEELHRGNFAYKQTPQLKTSKNS